MVDVDAVTPVVTWSVESVALWASKLGQAKNRKRGGKKLKKNLLL
jgi:hypothetical protein